MGKKQKLAEEYTKTIINTISAGIMASDSNGNIKAVNKHMTGMFGYTEKELKQKKAGDLFDGWDAVFETVCLGDAFLSEDVFVHSLKNVLQFNLSVYPVMDAQDNLTGMVYVFKEVKKVRKLANKIVGRQAIYTFDKIIGQSKEFSKTIEFAKQIADSRSTVLITGESGTGKEVFAQSIHNHSNRREESFVPLNCGAIPKNLIESELFGYDEGAFTGAKKSGHPGKFEIADGGTIFLDEIGEMPLDMQTRLLRVIEEGTVSRIGSTKEIVVDVRIIASTNKDLAREVDKGNFRNDLFYRLNVLPLRLPSLKERRDDVPLLIKYFMNRISKRINKKVFPVPGDYIDRLVRYDWPGNVRELENLVELMLNTGEIYDVDVQNKQIDQSDFHGKSVETNFNLENAEKRLIIRALRYFNGNITESAKALGIGRNTLYRKIKKYRLDV
ncbi:MAG TPA: sigma 54-interacting transcriptional regulator [Clostridia bacterium]|nr:sigma 54-interacting transcriptional regulator [Clostridia bacterium]